NQMEGNTVRWEIRTSSGANSLFQPLLNVGHVSPPLLGDGMNKQHGNTGERDPGIFRHLPIQFELLDILPWARPRAPRLPKLDFDSNSAGLSPKIGARVCLR